MRDRPRQKMTILGQTANRLRFILTHGRLPLRDRYWRRAQGGLRFRFYFMATILISAIASFSTLEHVPGLSRSRVMIPGLDTQLASIQTPNAEQIVSVLNGFRDQAGQIRRSAETRAAMALVAQAEIRRNIPSEQRLTIAAGDTLSTLLVQAGVSPDETAAAIKAMRKHVRPGDIRPGQVIEITRGTGFAAIDTFDHLRLNIDPVRSLDVKRNWGGFMTASMIEKPLKNDMAAGEAVIKGSLYAAAAAAGIPNAVTAEATKAFSHQIDFQRDIHPGDRLQIMYDRMVTDDGYVARTGGLIFARLYADNRELTIYRFQTRDGRIDYFDEKGNSIRKALLRTPMDGARVTSGFGMRRHPLLGYSKMHKGIDFGANTGTPIYASGDAIVEKAGRFGAYGNYVRLKHNNTLQTAYAHLSRYGPGIRPGTRVRQGQVIGYVGSTGRSTGPHLHYEILVNGIQVNPQSVNLPVQTALDSRDLRKFKDHVARLDRQFKERTQGIRYASSDGTGSPTALVQ